MLQNETVASQRPGHVSSQATNMLYAGEHFDTDSQNYYLRARWYDSLSGRFNRMDPFAGNNQDPQSLHKYLYCHANPINNIDPSGKITLASALFRVGLGLLLTSIFMTSFHGAYRRAKSVAARKNQTSVFNSIFKGAFTWNDWKYVLSGFGAGLEAGFINAFDTLTFRLVDPLNEYRDYLWQREGLEESWIGATANGFAWAGTASVYAAAAVWTWSAAGMGTMDIAVSKAGSPYFFHVQYGVNGVWQHAAGSIGNMWILPVRNVAGVVITGWPVLYPQAVMDAQTAFSCLTAATSAIARGWGV